METTYIVLIILTAIYIPLWIYIRFGKKLGLKGVDKCEEKGIVPYGPCIMIRTKLGMNLIERLGKYKRLWRVVGIFSRIVTILLMTYIVSIIIIDMIVLPSAIGKGGMGIEYALAIPGLNPMLPIVYGWIGLIFAMVVHELAHGIQSRANDIPVDSTGLLVAVVPVGAFVEPNEETIQKASRGARMDLYAAGITTNFIVAMITFFLMFAMVANTVSSDYSDSPGVYAIASGSPFMECEIPTTAIITEVDGTAIDNIDAFYDYVDTHGYGHYSLKYVYKGEERTVADIQLGTFVNGVVSGSPISKTGIKSGDFICKLNDTVIGSPSSMTSFLKNTKEGDVVSVTYVNGEGLQTTEDVALGNNHGVGYLGITTTMSGVSFTTPNQIMSTGIDPYYGCETISDYAGNTIGFIAKAFSGFSPVPESTHWWYHCSFASDDVMWILISLLYWIFWLNIVLGVTNALPAVPFDGGFLFMGGVDFIAERFVKDQEKRDRIVNTICTATTYFMLLALVLVLVVIIF